MSATEHAPVHLNREVPMKVYGDGWYFSEPLAKEILDDLVENHGCEPIGLVKSNHGSWGILYWSHRDLFNGSHDWAKLGHPFLGIRALQREDVRRRKEMA